MKVISVINQKGGVAKTTTSQAIASYLRLFKNKKVLSIDLDSQRSLTLINGASGEYSIVDVLDNSRNLRECIVDSNCGDMVISDKNLDKLKLGNLDINKLKKALRSVDDDYDYCVIDCPPNLSMITINALTSSNYCLIVGQADYLTLTALEQVNETINDVKEFNQELKVLGVAITRYSDRAVLSKDMVDNLRNMTSNLGYKVFDTKIRECIAIKESQAMRQDIFTYAPKSNGAIDYISLCDELLEVIN